VIRVCLVSATDPIRSPAIAALEGNDFDVIRLSVEAYPVEVAAVHPDVIVFETADGVPVVPTARRILRDANLDGVPLLLLLDASRLSLLERVPAVSDFVVTPFAGHELRARIRRLIVKYGQERHVSEMVFGQLVLSLDAHEVHVGEKEVALTHQEFKLLSFLASHPNRVYSREQLLNEVWGYDYFGGTRTVDVHVRRVRSKLGNRFGKTLSTVRNVGYKFVPLSA